MPLHHRVLHASVLHGAVAGKRGACCLPASGMPAEQHVALAGKVESATFFIIKSAMPESSMLAICSASAVPALWPSARITELALGGKD